MKERTIDQADAEDLSDEELAGKVVTGILTDVDRQEYTEMHAALIQKCREGPVPFLPEQEFVAASHTLDGSTHDELSL